MRGSRSARNMSAACQRHRSMACQIRRKTVSDIVGLRPDKTPLQSIEAAIGLSSIAQTEHFGALQRLSAGHFRSAPINRHSLCPSACLKSAKKADIGSKSIGTQSA
jgi:hypothetical protein